VDAGERRAELLSLLAELEAAAVGLAAAHASGLRADQLGDLLAAVGTALARLRPLAVEVLPVSQPAAPPAKRVLFVCVENSNRSQMAEAYARLLGGGRVEAYSAGSRPAGRINPRAVAFMKEVGYDLTTHRPKALSDLPAGELDVVVGMGCGDEGCPLVAAKRHEEGAIPDPKDLPADQYRAVRDLIERKVKELLARL
jgi:protein-tyrosine-phosphatase